MGTVSVQINNQIQYVEITSSKLKPDSLIFVSNYTRVSGSLDGPFTGSIVAQYNKTGNTFRLGMALSNNNFYIYNPTYIIVNRNSLSNNSITYSKKNTVISSSQGQSASIENIPGGTPMLAWQGSGTTSGFNSTVISYGRQTDFNLFYFNPVFQNNPALLCVGIEQGATPQYYIADAGNFPIFNGSQNVVTIASSTLVAQSAIFCSVMSDVGSMINDSAHSTVCAAYYSGSGDTFTITNYTNTGLTNARIAWMIINPVLGV